MYCPKCGAENPENAKFCGSCGSTMVIERNTGTQLNAAHNFQPKNTQAVSKEFKIVITIVSIVIPLVGIIMGWIYMTNADPEKKKVGRLWLYVGIGSFIAYCILYSIGINSTSYYY